jgi:hypothetical protein
MRLSNEIAFSVARWVKGRAGRRIAPLALLLAGCCLALPAGASAAGPAPGLTIDSFALPGNFSAADNATCLTGGEASHLFPCDRYQVKVTDASDVPTDGTPITISDTVPAGLTVQRIQLFWSAQGLRANDLGFLCSTATVQCTFPATLAPGDTLEMLVYVTVDDPSASGELAGSATVSGGGASTASTGSQNTVGEVAAAFGAENFSSFIAGLDGAPDAQAGGHPYELTTRIDFATRFEPIQVNAAPLPQDEPGPRDIVVDLPLGFMGSALAAPRCTFAQLNETGAQKGEAACPPDTVVGHLLTDPISPIGVDGPIYNMVPEQGVAAEFGFADHSNGTHALYAKVVPGPGGYVLQVTAPDIPQAPFEDLVTTFFGDPAAQDGNVSAPLALFTNPSECDGQPLTTSLYMDSWEHPASFNADGTPDLSDPNWVKSTSVSPPVTGCNQLQFSASLSALPDTTVADSPSGLHVDIQVPQSEAPGTLATPPLDNASVTLPEGLTVNPSSAAGLAACTPAEIALQSANAPSCPQASQIGTVQLQSPLIPGTLQGEIYLASEYDNPFDSLLAGYIVVDDPTTGLVIKVPGNLTPNPLTGQITGVFDSSPQFPFTDLELDFKGGARGVLATPEGCGTYTTISDLAPWSAPESGADATPSSSFPIASGCVSGFSPAFSAGSENPQAGGYSPFALSVSRTDGEQNLAGLSVTLPPGLLGKIAGIPLCPDANANAGACPEASLVGSVQASAGVGPDPYWVSGKAYLTGPYNGGAYGLVVEIPAVAGPFDLGTVVVRQSLRIDPHTAQVTAVSDSFPTILDGIPLRVRGIDVTLDRPSFTFNPTSCTPMAVTGTLASTQGTAASVSSRFQAGGCRELPFAPKFSVSTQARTSKKNGASLLVKGSFTAGNANIHAVAVTLPKQLPARLTTIQQACTAAVFAANPAGCPAGSNIGTATASTPILANPVTGPVYLVSHGGAAFPDVVAILQGEGVTVDLTGNIDIKHNITSSTFATVPDAPITSFQLTLPEGPHSGLAAVVPAKAKGSLCGQSLAMPFTITGQNGAVIKQPVKITVTGCPKTKKKPKTKHKKTRKKK